MPAPESYPDDLKYHSEHDWARIEGDDATMGITWFAQDSLGELVHYEAPEVGATIAKDFTGVEALRLIREEGPARRLVPFVMEEKAVPRQGMPIEGGGEVTSGTHSPMLDRGIGMGYVPSAGAAPGSELVIDVRGKSRRARVVKKPIYRKEG